MSVVLSESEFGPTISVSCPNLKFGPALRKSLHNGGLNGILYMFSLAECVTTAVAALKRDGQEIYMGGFGSIWHWLILLVIVLLFVKPSKLPELGKSLGKAISEFKDSLNNKDDSQNRPSDETPPKA